MTERRTLSPMKRLRVFEKAGGRCYLCEQRIQVGEKWEVEHVRAIGLLGEDDESNMAPAHVGCHATKTKADIASMSKAKRVKAKHVGGYRSANPMPGSKASRWKRRMDGTTELRRET